MFYYSGNPLLCTFPNVYILILNEALNSYTNLETTMYNLYFVSQAVEMPRLYFATQITCMLFELLLAGLV
jgi:hypothetical protein